MPVVFVKEGIFRKGQRLVTEVRHIDFLPTLIQAFGLETSGSGFDNIAIILSGLAGFDAWAAGFGLYGSNAVTTIDLEPDRLDGWTEYMLGGNPTLDDSATILPASGIVQESGTNWLEYVYRRRSDYQALGLNYTVEAATNLASGTWSTEGVLDAGYGPIDDEIDSVTNRVSTEELPQQFIRLRME